MILTKLESEHVNSEVDTDGVSSLERVRDEGIGGTRPFRRIEADSSISELIDDRCDFNFLSVVVSE